VLGAAVELDDDVEGEPVTEEGPEGTCITIGIGTPSLASASANFGASAGAAFSALPTSLTT
jgi:hypothetical protein